MSAEPRDSWRGRRVDRFEVTSLLGKGATGAVYRARDLVAGREVALKVLLHTRLEDRHRARFQREGELTASLDHPSIVRVHSAGELPGGVPFLAYELVEGARSLADACAGEPDLARRVGWVRDAARGLGVAHAQGIVHRDVKPDNLLVDGEGRLKIADFGAAWFAGAERLTRTGGLVGTPYFMPPEQLAGVEATPAGDVWSLGVTLYTVLTGEYPFDAETIDELRMKVLGAEPVALRLKNPAVSQAIERVCERCLEKEPAARYPHGAALAADLERALTGQPVLARSSSARRARRRALLVATALLVIAPAVALGLLSATPPPPQLPVAIAPTVTRVAVTPIVTTPPPPPPRRAPRTRPPSGISDAGANAFREALGGSALFMNLVGDHFRNGSNGYPQDLEQAELWYERGAELGEDSSMSDLGDMLLDDLRRPGDAPRAVELLERAAAKHNQWANRKLTDVYLKGQSGVPADWAKAAHYLERVARISTRETNFFVYAGDCFRTGGPNLARDAARAVELYECGVTVDNVMALSRLGSMLAAGDGIARDVARARTLLERAARAGDEEAARALRALPDE